MNYKTTSSKLIVERVFGLLGTVISQDSDRFLGNVIEWLGAGLELVGVMPAMESIDKALKVSNGRILLPCNLYQIKSVSYDNQWLPYGSATFNYDAHCSHCINEYAARNLPFSYTINPNYLMTNVPDGDHICISYLALSTDKDGFPLIPDRESCKQALIWFCIYNLMFGGFEHPNRQITFEVAQNNWLKYCSQAENDLAMLDKPQLAAFKNAWVRLIPNMYPEDNFFSTQNDREILRQKINFNDPEITFDANF